MITIELPWPPRALWRNSEGSHWAARSRARRKAKTDAKYLALEAGVRNLQTPTPVLVFHFHPRKRGRKPDCHNLPDTMKAYIDGIALAMDCDDKGFKCRFPDELSEPVEGGKVVVWISDPEAGL